MRIARCVIAFLSIFTVHAVQALPVEIDDPDDVSETANRFLGDRFPDIPFVELGIAHEREDVDAVVATDVRSTVTEAGHGTHRRSPGSGRATARVDRGRPPFENDGG